MIQEHTSLTERYINVNDINTRYFDEGDGPTILLLHGGHFGLWIPGSADIWSDAISALSSQYRVVALDKLGQGYTDLPRSDSDWTFESVVQHLVAFIDKLDLKNILLVGHSRGGLLASQVALDLPNRVKGLCIVSSASLTTTDDDPADITFYDDVWNSLSNDASARDVVHAYFEAQWASQGSFEPYVAAAEKMYLSDKHQEAMQTLSKVEAEYWNPSLERSKNRTRARLLEGECRVPIQIVWGREDKSAPVSLGYPFFQLLAGNTDWTGMTVLAEAGHNVFVEQPDAFYDIVRAHASRCL